MEVKMSKKLNVLMAFVVILLIFAATQVSAQNRPIQISIFTPVQIFPEDDPVSSNHDLSYTQSLTAYSLKTYSRIDFILSNLLTKQLYKTLIICL